MANTLNKVNSGGIEDGSIINADVKSDAAIAFSKLQDVSATDRILGRDSSGAGDIEEITPANVRTMLNVEDGADVTDATNVAAAGGILKTTVDAKGDILAATADNTVARLAVGTNDKVLTADSSEATGLKWATVSSSDTLSNRNLIINGDCQINQRHGVGGNVTGLTNGAADYGADRWQIKITNPSGGTWAFNHTDTSYEAGGFRRSVQLALTGGAQATSAAETMIYIRHTVEARNAVRLAWGTGSAKQLTLSFWMNCNVAGDGQVNIQHGEVNKRVSGTYTYSSAGSWQKQTITFPASAEEVNNDTGVGFRVEWVVCAGADAKTGSVQTSWATPAEGDRGAGQTINIATTVGHKFAITGVQLEEGSTATEFERLAYGTNLLQCLRYYYKINADDQGDLGVAPGWCRDTEKCHGNINFPIPMRINPSSMETTGTAGDYAVAHKTSGPIGQAVPTFDSATQYSASLVLQVTGNPFTAGECGRIQKQTNSAFLAWNAEY